MNAEQWSRLRDLFAECQDLPQTERGAYLDRKAGDDPELRAELNRLLTASASATDFFAPSPTTPSHGTIGPYRLLEILGEGGFGVVYLAEQVHPIRRRVALKLIKPGMDTKQVIARFEAERQAIAMMDHPAIAQVFEAGTTPTGRPYFAMEYVPGIPITTFCDRERLDIRDRLELFLKVCDAIQHAHQKGAIHRDIKPANVLVTRRDGAPAPKVIDFGIVKATTDTATGATLITREGMIVGTLGTMSPEQAGATDAVDTRTDIYSLGVLLYEMLCGAPPFDAERLKKVALSDAVRIVREEEPPSLGDQLARNGEIATAVAEQRSTDGRRLSRELRGELQWITWRALEKDPDRRYASAAELAADIRRHLANEPVLAGAPSTMYRVRKYARRHRVAVIAGSFVLLAIVAGGVAAGVGLRRAVAAERVARREAESSRQVADFLVELFQASSPDRTKGEVVTARTLLDEGTRKIETELPGDPLVRSRLLDAMGSSYLGLGVHDEGVRLARAALEAAEAAGPGSDLEVARRLWALAQALATAAPSDSVLTLVDRAIAILETADETDTLLLANCLSRKALWWSSKGDAALADSFVTLALALAESEQKPDPEQLMRFHSTKAYLAHLRFDLEEADDHFVRTLEFAKQADQPSWIAITHTRLATLYGQTGDLERAMMHADQGVLLARQIYPPEHRNLADALRGRAIVLTDQGKYREAIVAFEEVLRIERAAGTPAGLTFTLDRLADLYRVQGPIHLAIARGEEASSLCLRTWGRRNLRSAQAMAQLARCYAGAKEAQRADSTFREAIDVIEELGDTSILAIETQMDHANFCRDQGWSDRAESSYVCAEALLDSTNTGLQTHRGRCLIERAYLRSLQGRHEEAEVMMRAGFALRRGDTAEYDSDLSDPYLTWAALRARADDVEGAKQWIAKARRCGATAENEALYPELAAYRASSP